MDRSFFCRPLRPLVLFAILLPAISGCDSVSMVRSKWVWQVNRVRSSPHSTEFITPYHPQIQRITLTLARPNVAITAMSPFEVPSDSSHADSIYKLLTNINDRTRLRRHSNCWYILRLTNLTGFTHWALRTVDVGQDPKLYLERSKDDDSLRETKSVSIPWAQNNRVKEYIFPFEMGKWSELGLLLNVKNDEIPFTNEFTLYPYTKSWSVPADTWLFAEVIICATVLLSLLSIYAFTLSRDPVFLLFFLYVVVSLLNSLNQIYWHYWIPYLMTPDLSPAVPRLVLIILMPFTRPRVSRRLVIYIACILLYLFFYFSRSLFSIYFGPGYSGVTNLLLLIAYIYFCIDQAQIDRRVSHWLPLVVILAVFQFLHVAADEWLQLFYVPYIYQWEEAAFGGILVFRFWQFRKNRQKMLLQQAVAAEKDISKTVISTLENERERISQDIHDELGGNLAVLKIKIQSLTRNAEQLDLVMKIIDKAADSVRTISHRLMPPDFARTELNTLLEEQLGSLNETGPMQFQFLTIGTTHGFAKDEELMIYRVIMELVHNCLKHSRADHVIVQLAYNENQLEILCEDDGVGFSSSLQAGVGLKSIHSRIMYLNGEITIDSSPAGTTVIIRIPMTAKYGSQ